MLRAAEAANFSVRYEEDRRDARGQRNLYGASRGELFHSLLLYERKEVASSILVQPTNIRGDIQSQKARRCDQLNLLSSPRPPHSDRTDFDIRKPKNALTARDSTVERKDHDLRVSLDHYTLLELRSPNVQSSYRKSDRPLKPNRCRFLPQHLMNERCRAG